MGKSSVSPNMANIALSVRKTETTLGTTDGKGFCIGNWVLTKALTGKSESVPQFQIHQHSGGHKRKEIAVIIQMSGNYRSLCYHSCPAEQV